MEANSKQNIFVSWFLWQFYETPVFLLQVWKSYIMFATNLFSVSLLLKTFFSPWRRYKWRYPKSFDLVEFLNTLLSNIFSRIIGAIMRIVLIIIGILFQIIVVFTGLIIFLGWILIPFIIIAGFLFVLIY